MVLLQCLRQLHTQRVTAGCREEHGVRAVVSEYLTRLALLSWMLQSSSLTQRVSSMFAVTCCKAALNLHSGAVSYRGLNG